MKLLTTLITLLLSCTMLAQGPVEFPWNPDSDGDDFIGVNDLMALLGEFDSVFSEEGLYLSDDSLSAMYDVGTQVYLECQIACKNLPGKWKIPQLNEVVVFGQETWIESPVEWQNSNALSGYLLEVDGRPVTMNLSAPRGCLCVTKERPKVEYSYCDGEDPTDMAFTQCINEKLAQGWYPLSGFPNHYDYHRYGSAGGQNSADYRVHTVKNTHASFWRWAE